MIPNRRVRQEQITWKLLTSTSGNTTAILGSSIAPTLSRNKKSRMVRSSWRHIRRLGKSTFAMGHIYILGVNYRVFSPVDADDAATLDLST